MYALHLMKYEADVEEPGIKEWLYRKIFNEEFNLSFAYPRSDTCETCTLLRISASTSETDRAQYQGQLAAHQEHVSQGYRSLREDAEASRNSDGHTVITFDLMHYLPVPTLTHGCMFYLRQLWVSNLGIHNSTTGSASLADCLCNVHYITARAKPFCIDISYLSTNLVCDLIMCLLWLL